MVNLWNYSFKFKCGLLLLLATIKMSNCQENSCQNFFEYKYGYSNDVYGVIITVPSSAYYDNAIRLNVELSIGNRLNKEDIKNVIFTGSAEDVVYKRPLVFSLDFPPWNNIPPQITYISVNDRLLCVGQHVTGTREVSTVTLVSTIGLTAAPNSGNNGFAMKKNMDYSHSFNPNDIFKNNNWRRTQSPEFFRPDFQNEFNGEFPSFNPKNRYPFDRTWPTTPPTFTFRPNSPNTDFNFVPTPTKRSEKRVNTNNNLYSCGLPMISPNRLIANGDTVKKGAHPWTGALFYKKSLSNPEFLCGASLLTKKLAITAGHCVAPYSVSDLYITFGRIGVNDWLDENTQNAKVEKTELHPAYKEETSDADIAIIFFVNELIFTATVKPICLWDLNGLVQNITNEMGVVVGWGRDEHDNFTVFLQEIYLRVVSEEDCLRSSEEFINITSNRTFCAGNNRNAGPCNGDSGSGFYFYINQRWTLRGIVSRSLLNFSGRCDLSKYTVYVDVAKHMQWIRQFL